MSGPRLSDRALKALLIVAAALLLAAAGFAVLINAEGPLAPVPVASSPRA
ncbi:MAG: hypothetical protein QM582_05045 [Micropruina sp.]